MKHSIIFLMILLISQIAESKGFSEVEVSGAEFTSRRAHHRQTTGFKWLAAGDLERQRCVQFTESGEVEPVPLSEVKELCPKLREYSEEIEEATRVAGLGALVPGFQCSEAYAAPNVPGFDILGENLSNGECSRRAKKCGYGRTKVRTYAEKRWNTVVATYRVCLAQ